MKTKKISWQAIAIVVLALVLIASIALGVSGAWFQDKDSENTELTLGHAVKIKLVDTNNTANEPVTWSKTYSGAAYPGDLVFGATSILPGEAYGEPTKDKVSAAVYRIKISAKVSNPTEATWYDSTVKTRPTDTTAEDYEKKLNSYLINDMIANATDATFKTNWKEGNAAGEDGLKWYYYQEINQSSSALPIFNELRLSNEITNIAAGLKISVTVNVEAIQAANLATYVKNGETWEETVQNEDWMDDMDTTLRGKVAAFNQTGRAA